MKTAISTTNVGCKPSKDISKDSELCLACGLCCQGILHDHAELPEEEVEAAGQLGLTIYPKNKQIDYRAFSLPCPCFLDNACTVYAQRPTTCRQYQCLLLQRYLDGSVSIEDCLATVNEVKQTLDDIRAEIGGDDMTRRLWSQVKSFLHHLPGQTDTHRLQVNVIKARQICYEKFDPLIEGTEFPRDGKPLD